MTTTLGKSNIIKWTALYAVHAKLSNEELVTLIESQSSIRPPVDSRLRTMLISLAHSELVSTTTFTKFIEEYSITSKGKDYLFEQAEAWLQELNHHLLIMRHAMYEETDHSIKPLTLDQSRFLAQYINYKSVVPYMVQYCLKGKQAFITSQISEVLYESFRFTCSQTILLQQIERLTENGYLLRADMQDKAFFKWAKEDDPALYDSYYTCIHTVTRQLEELISFITSILSKIE
ncbi:hypothetical protein AB3N04_00065 (plasmid) [Alkalihalophilus sp. As8PL]|uniref:Uncharacterized protein n=1 Tax=Alkalihalophilus sp. As8PL TaxID=3237103 RepID=A0AB39BMV6_9BACI